jgi:acetyl esterase/lipase
MEVLVVHHDYFEHFSYINIFLSKADDQPKSIISRKFEGWKMNPSLSMSLSPCLYLGKFFMPRVPAILPSSARASGLYKSGLFSPINQRKSSLQILVSSSSSSSLAMDSSNSNEVAYDHSPFLKIYKDGRVERIAGTDIVPPSLDPQTGVESKDVVISPETGVSARLFLPKTSIQTQKKLPLLIYFHGGGFCIETAFSPQYHNYLNALVGEANVVAVSVDYRRAPEHPLPAAYSDSWAALEWVASRVDEWLKSHVDFERVFFAGDSAGANIAHHMALRVGAEGLAGVKLQGIALVHPYFWGKEPIGGEPAEAERRAMIENLWRFTCPATSGTDDPYINPASDPKLGSLGCGSVLVCVAEKDLLKARGFYYRELLEKSGWGGAVEVVESPGEDHVFHLNKPVCENSLALLNRIASFFNRGEP